jgi:penicillin amidase
VLALVVVVVLVVSVGATTIIRRSFPDRDGTASLPGLDARVTVLRDDRGVPQIYASTAADLFRAQGYVHAQDRFFEMDLRRHITAGRLSELVGPSEDALNTDKVVRTLGWRRVAEQELPLLSPTTRSYLQAYADGVNAYLAHRSQSQLGVEYALLGLTLPDYRIEPWTPVDSLAWLKAMAWDLKSNYTDEITRSRLAATLPVKRINQLYPPYPFDQHAPILSDADLQQSQSASDVPVAALRTASARHALEAAQHALDAIPDLVGPGDGVGSNSWVVSGAHTTTGMPLLANDPHLAPSVPSIWYQMGLHCQQVDDTCPFDVAGFTFSGLPGVIIGHNDRIAWGFTNLGPDVTDLYLERTLNDTVEVDGSYEPLAERTETIDVRGGDPVTITVRSTKHGPIVSDVIDSVRAAGSNPIVNGELDTTSYDVALSWTALQPGRTADAIFQLDAARDWDGFRAAARLFEVPAQNLVYADVDGNIGYQAPGKIPVRSAGDGRWPVPGWQSRYDWTGYVPFEDLPHVLNPKEGMVVTANQAVSDDVTPFLTDDWDYGFRSQRIRELLEKKPKLSAADMSRIQMDNRNPMAPTLVPLLLAVDFSKDAFTREAQQLLSGWDFTQPPDSAAAAYYNAVWRQLLRLGFDDELGQDLAADGGDRWFEVVSLLLKRKDDPWWDNKATPGAVENRDEIVRQAMTAARIELTKSLGKDPTHWQWGRLHRLDLHHAVLGGPTVPTPVRWLVNRGPWDLGGGSSLVDATGWDAHAGYAVDWVPSMRMVVDLGDLDRSTWVNLTGASGHPMDAHYTDQTDAWAQGRTYPWPFSEEAVRKASDDELLLRPEP